jgi:hypothetical protein
MRISFRGSCHWLVAARPRSNGAVLQSVLAHQIAHSERLHQEQLQRQERADFEMIVGLANDSSAFVPRSLKGD